MNCPIGIWSFDVVPVSPRCQIDLTFVIHNLIQDTACVWLPVYCIEKTQGRWNGDIEVRMCVRNKQLLWFRILNWISLTLSMASIRLAVQSASTWLPYWSSSDQTVVTWMTHWIFWQFFLHMFQLHWMNMNNYNGIHNQRPKKLYKRTKKKNSECILHVLNPSLPVERSHFVL